MKKILIGLFVFFVNVTTSLALTFDVNLTTDKEIYQKDDVAIITFSISNIISNTGIGGCKLTIEGDKNLTLVKDVNVFDNSWEISGNSLYLLTNENSFMNDFDLFSISYKVSNTGIVNFNDIICTGIVNGEEEEESQSYSKSITINVNSDVESSSLNKEYNNSDVSSSSSNNASSSSNNSTTKDSDICLKGFNLSSGYIKFDKNVFNYNISVNNIKDFTIEAKFDIGCNLSQHEDESDDGRKFIYTVIEDNNIFKYTINVKENLEEESESSSSLDNFSSEYSNSSINSSSSLINEENSKKDYKIIFIIIIVILLGLNIYRIIKRNKNEESL